MNARLALIAVGLGFGVWEAVDTFDTGVPAAVFSVLFLACSVWLSRRKSVGAAIAIAALCTVEASQAHTWKDAGTTAKDAAMALGSAGIVAALAFVLPRTINPKGATR